MLTPRAAHKLLITEPIYGRSPGLDLLRFAFAFWVLLVHLIPWAAAVQGSEAVPALLLKAHIFLGKMFQSEGENHPAVVGFIVLSGYCIHRNGLRSDPSQLRTYIIRRLMRIAPVFILATMAGAIMLPISAAINPQFTLVLNGMTFAEPICLLARITTVAAMTSYFDPCAYAGNAPLGTVVAEIDLYIAYALFFWIFVWRGRGYLMFSVIIATFGISLVVISLASYNYQRWFQQNSFISFLPYWWIGALVVNQEVADRLRRIAPILVLFWLGFAAVVAFSAAAPVAGELKKLCYALLIAALIVKMDTIAISDNPMSALGRAGYSIYAFHSPVLCLGLIFGLNPILCLALALIIGILSYRLIELPCIQIGRQMSARPLMVR